MSEEIEQEIEVLRAIYQDELSGSAATGLILDVRPTPGSEEHCELKLTFTIPKTYPQAAPTVTATPVKGVTADEANKLLAILKECAAENIGQQMVFTLASAAKEWLDDLNVHYDERHKKAQEVEAAKEAEKEAAAERERERARGTPVTRATFLAWNAKFQEELRQKEMAAAKEAAAAAAAAGLDKEKKLTGRALFESDASLVMSDAALLETFKNEPLPDAVPAALLADPDSAALFDDAGLDDDTNDVAPSPAPEEVEAASK